MLVGIFYELYDIVDPATNEGQTNVKQAVEALGITLSTKKADGPKKEDCLFAGFPEQSLQKFAGILTKDGWTVVVAGQDKDVKGKVSGRSIIRIFSPGTHVEVAGVEAPYLAGVWFEEGDLKKGLPPTYAASVLDLTTGKMISYDGVAQGQVDQWSTDSLIHFFQVHVPKETIIWWEGAKISCPSESTFRRRLGLTKGSVHIETTTFKEMPLYLEKMFTGSLLPLKEQLSIKKKCVEKVLCYLLRFAEDHMPSVKDIVSDHMIWSPEKAVYLGNNTLTQLNYISSGQEQSIYSLFQKTLTSLGKRGLRDRLLYPSSNADEIQKKLTEVEYLYTTPTKSIESSLRFIHDLARLHHKIVVYSIDATDILALDQSYGSMMALQGTLQGSCMAMSSELESAFTVYQKQFLEIFDIEKAKISLGNQDISFLPSAKAPKVAEAEQKLKEVKKKVDETLDTILRWASLPADALKIESLDSLTYFFTGTKTILTVIKELGDKKGYPFPGFTIKLKKTSRGSIEFPLLEGYHFQTLGYRQQLQTALKEELPALCRQIESTCWPLIESWVSHVDVTLCLASVAKERGYVKPIIVDTVSSGIEATGLRHPLIESIQTRTEYIKHDVSLGFEKDRGWLLYGMNASGKSSLMKSVGISVLLAQAGSYVPASSFKISPFQHILTRILNQDSIWSGLSSFAVEISELRDIFDRATNRSLVLGDELCSGTESISATSLVAAGIKHLHKKESRFMFATHLHGLHSLTDITSLSKLGTWHLRVRYDPVTEKLIYDRTLHKGPGGTLYGLEVAKAMNLSFDILKEAHRYRKELLGEVHEETALASSWNSQITRKECELCKHPIVKDLEVHHIRPRSEAVNKKFEDGSTMNDLRNLIVVCQSCHDKHHAGEIQIGPVKQTSGGLEREVLISKPTVVSKQKKWSDEEIQTIENYIKTYPSLPLSRIVYDLKQQEDIIISEGTLRKFRNQLQ